MIFLTCNCARFFTETGNRLRNGGNQTCARFAHARTWRTHGPDNLKKN